MWTDLMILILRTKFSQFSPPFLDEFGHILLTNFRNRLEVVVKQKITNMHVSLKLNKIMPL